jgi:hypothetical protein
MASIFKPKRSSVVGRVPTTADLVDGEIGINIPDSKIYINTGGVISVIADSAAGGAGYQVLTIDDSGDLLQANKRYVVDSSGGALNFTMPSALLSAGTFLEFVDLTGYWNINTVTINSPGVGLYDAQGNLDEFPLYLDLAFSGLKIVYDGANWRMVALS